MGRKHPPGTPMTRWHMQFVGAIRIELMRVVTLALSLSSLLPACQHEAVVAPDRPGAATLAQVEELRSFVPDATHVILDLRPPDAYAAGHVPGSVHVDVAGLRAEVDGVPEQLAPRAQIEALLAAVGVDLGDEIVVLDADAGPPAARLVWTLLHFGHAPARVRLLDGGWAAWVASGAPVSSEPTPAAPASSAALGSSQPASLVDAGWILAHQRDPAVLLLDVRTDEEWSAGRIPGAQHIPWKQARGADGRLLPTPALRELYAHAMATPTVVTYCKSGMRASATWFALRLLGHPDVRLYDGSWNEWGARLDLPVER